MQSKERIGPPVVNGYVYAIEMLNGVKIGRSKSPENRIKDLLRYSGITGVDVRRKISLKHNNYASSERTLHLKFKEFRVGKSELFLIPFEEASKAIDDLACIFVDDDVIKGQIVEWARKTSESVVGGFSVPQHPTENTVEGIENSIALMLGYPVCT